MTRRTALASLVGAATGRAEAAAATMLIRVRSREVIAVQNAAVAEKVIAPPGSTLKPLVLAGLLKRGKLSATERYVCPGKLAIGGRSLNCSHPRVEIPMTVETALAYSCNCFVAHMAERFGAGELASALLETGLVTRIGWIAPATGPDATRLQALGEDGVVVTLEELAMAYRRLAMRVGEAEARAVAAGLSGAVAYGTAQRAAVAGMSISGKTGSVRTADGARIAWFAGYAPSDKPDVVVAVMLQGRSGGSDAAPVAARILEAYRTSQ